VELVTDRTVRPFIDLAAADQDRHTRGRCLIFDLHGLWWTVPTELTVHDVNVQVVTQLAAMDLHQFHHDPWRALLDLPRSRQ